MLHYDYDVRSFGQVLTDYFDNDPDEKPPFPLTNACINLVWIITRDDGLFANRFVADAFRRVLLKNMKDDNPNLRDAFQALAVALVPYAVDARLKAEQATAVTATAVTDTNENVSAPNAETLELTEYWGRLLHEHGAAVLLKLSTKSAAGSEELEYQEESYLLAECLRSKGVEALREYLRVVGLDDDLQHDADTIEDLFRPVLADGNPKLLQVLCSLLVLKADREGVTTTDVFMERIFAEAA